tara:strand:+ start:2205 stop:2564 length:360 start_codon:yes stop_codon:yes gene_type:complete
MMTTVILSSQGISLFKHFCEGELTSFEIYEKHNDPCCGDQHNPCDECEDEEAVWSLDDFNHSKVSISFLSQLFDTKIERDRVISTHPTLAPKNTLNAYFNDPISWSGRQRSILYQSFLL